MKTEDAAENMVMFLTGMAVGAGVALLLAPQPGKKTRRQIRRKAEDAQGYMTDLGEELISKGRDLVERGKEAAEGAVKDLGKKAGETTS
jgi:gas vesicle protein